MAKMSDGNEFHTQMADLVEDLGGKELSGNDNFGHGCLVP